MSIQITENLYASDDKVADATAAGASAAMRALADDPEAASMRDELLRRFLPLGPYRLDAFIAGAFGAGWRQEYTATPAMLKTLLRRLIELADMHQIGAEPAGDLCPLCEDGAAVAP